VLVPPVLGALKAAKVGITPGIVEVSLGVTAAGLLGVALASPARHHRLRLRGPQRPLVPHQIRGHHIAGWTVRPARHGLPTGDSPHPVLAIQSDGNQTLYLVLPGSTSQKTVAGKEIDVYDGGPTWISQEQVSAFAAAQPS
jgi:hypothetical protein